MSEYTAATILLRRHDGTTVEIDIPPGNYVDATTRAVNRPDGPTKFGPPSVYIMPTLEAIEINIRVEFAMGGPDVLATRTIRPAEEPDVDPQRHPRGEDVPEEGGER